MPLNQTFRAATALEQAGLHLSPRAAERFTLRQYLRRLGRSKDADAGSPGGRKASVPPRTGKEEAGGRCEQVAATCSQP